MTYYLSPVIPSFLPKEVETSTQLTRTIRLNIPLVSAAMDTVTEAGQRSAWPKREGSGSSTEICLFRLRPSKWTR